MAEVPGPVHSIRRAARRIMRKFETERSDAPPYDTTWQLAIVVCRDEEDGLWVAECTDLPGAMSQGETEEEAIENLTDAIGGVLAARLSAQLAGALPKGHAPGNDPHEHKIALTV